MQQELEDFCIPITASNIKENVDTLYNSHNTTRKQPEPLRPSSDCLNKRAEFGGAIT